MKSQALVETYGSHGQYFFVRAIVRTTDDSFMLRATDDRLKTTGSCCDVVYKTGGP
jgi:predicted secreted protein